MQIGSNAKALFVMDQETKNVTLRSLMNRSQHLRDSDYSKNTRKLKKIRTRNET